MVKILAIDDDEDFCYSIKRIIMRLGHEFFSEPSIKDGLEIVEQCDFDLILLDVGLPDGSGLDILPTLKELSSIPEVVIITGEGYAEGAELAILNGAWDYIEKTASTKKISLTVTRALQYRDERKKTKKMSHVTALKRDSIIGDSPKMKKSLDFVAKAAACDANVLITGETGTGKELFANAVHTNSNRYNHELVTIDCASLPENLAENLLFGHKKGVYTGASDNSKGLIEMADKGTLFLDEIGELSLPLQKAFLRVLQERKFRPLGGSKEIKSDFRLVAATNRDLDEMVKNKTFRSDLLFRIKSFHIELPKLSDRDEDIKKLSKHYLDYFSEEQMLDSKGVSSDFFDALKSYDWAGNVRELANTMEHVIIASLNEPTVFPKHLPKHMRIHIAQSKLSDSKKETKKSHEYSKDNMPNLSDYRDHVILNYEKRYLSDLLRSTENIKEACDISGISRSRLYALLKKHGLNKHS